jgi:hypothetical protein
MQHISRNFQARLRPGQGILCVAELQQKHPVLPQFREPLQRDVNPLFVEGVECVRQKIKVHDQS